MKAYFLQRVAAYVVDFILIFMLVQTLVYFIPVSKAYKEASDASAEIFKDFTKSGDIDDFYERTSHYSYVMEKEGYVFIVISFVAHLGYFVWYQTYAKGQTLGKRFLKIAIKRDDDSDINIMDSLKRGIILRGYLTTVITMTCLLFMKENTYMGFSVAIEFGVMAAFIVCVLMVAFREDSKGLHDMFAGTKVVLANEIALEPIVEEAVIIDINEKEGSEENERTNRTRDSKKRKSTRNSKKS